jgi:hypothetical protein
MAKQRVVISKSARKKQCPKGSSNLVMMEQVVYKTPLGKVNGKMKYSSQTRHEVAKKE